MKNSVSVAMGNSCFKSNKVMAQDESCLALSNSPPVEAKKVEEKLVAGSAMAKPKTAEERSGASAGKKVVRFKLQEEDENSGGSGGDGDRAGVLRIKVVMSQRELKQILKEKENSSRSLEELIAEFKVKGRTTVSDARIDEVEDENGSRRPALECIPEGLH